VGLDGGAVVAVSGPRRRSRYRGFR